MKNNKYNFYYKTYKSFNQLPKKEKTFYKNCHRGLFNSNADGTEYPCCKFLVTYLDFKPVGLIVYEKILWKNKEGIELNLVYVLSKFRKKGILRGMFNHLLRYYKLLHWGAVTTAIPAYEKLGSKCYGGSYYYINENLFVKNKLKKT
jgi:GNAT superfamily N-acetyltransferase